MDILDGHLFDPLPKDHNSIANLRQLYVTFNVTYIVLYKVPHYDNIMHFFADVHCELRNFTFRPLLCLRSLLGVVDENFQ